FWTGPILDRPDEFRKAPVSMAGPGGERLRFGPEVAYAWVGKARDVATFTNYRVQPDEDPGKYRFTEQTPSSARLEMRGNLVDYRTRKATRFSVERTVLETPPPLELEGLDYVGYQTQHRIELLSQSATIGLWHLIQFPPKTTLIVPTRRKVEPLQYFNRGDWKARADHVSWTFCGEGSAKMGLSARDLTGRMGAIRKLESGRWALVVRQFPLMNGLYYADAPAEKLAGDQVVQAWDGVGFGEMEYHSPAVGRRTGMRVWQEAALLWAFGGSAAKIRAVAAELLGVEIRPLMK
ncbi:MAG TPA: DUF6786 family protein, partial [Polyangiaceae bacterium]|nr:DUF6786 family protein [Polyangiaceae bacterium]